MAKEKSIVVLDGGRRLPRADLLYKNRLPGLYARISTTQLGGMAIKAALENTAIDPGLIGHAIMGMAAHSHRDSIYGAQGMRWRGGLGYDVPALTVARICGSGAEAISVAAEMALAGLRHDEKRPFYVVGGGESMQYPFTLYNYRGRMVGNATQKYGPIDTKALPAGTTLQDSLLMCLYDPAAKLRMASTAEELGRRYGITREECDRFGYRSHVNAKKARDAGHFDEELVPVTVQQGGAAPPVTVKYDEHILENPSLEKMARLPAAFEAGGIITAGNASAVVDGAAAMVLGLESDAERYGLKPLCRIIGYGVAGVDPRIMGYGPVPASRKALENAGLKGDQIDIVELNEAFAPQSLACLRDMEEYGIDPEKVNPMGNAIALGHPLGATGAVLFLTCAYALRRRKLRYGLVTMCIGGGQGIALILESIH
ncbi:MAG: thiolase family protein [Acidobacteria bacterium]|nr:thiolase family protein [Acidobacteriota bacterium]